MYQFALNLAVARLPPLKFCVVIELIEDEVGDVFVICRVFH